MKALLAFEATARRGSVKDAAAELAVTPGAISQQIKKLESILGVRLLERSGRSVELTTWGLVYFEEIAPPFEALRDAQAKLHRRRSGSGLVISCLASVASRWLGPQLFDWQALNPASRVRLVGAEAEPRLLGDDVDFRLSYGSKRTNFDFYADLFTDRVVPACAPSLLADRPVTDAEAILAHPLIGIEWDASHQPPPSWDDWIAAAGIACERKTTELTFSLSSTALDAAVNGRGFVLAQIAMIGNDLAAGRLVVPVDLRVPLSESYFLAWDSSALDKPFGGPFRDWILALSRVQQRLSISGDLGARGAGTPAPPRPRLEPDPLEIDAVP